jgi:hypothetical protein
MMSITPTAIIASASPRPYATQRSTSVVGQLVGASFGANWVCFDHMSIKHNPTTVTTESKRLDPGSLAGVLT